MDEIAEKIKRSKKYRDVYGKTIERIADECIKRFGEKRAEKEAKNLLHQVWGAFYSVRPDFKKAFLKLGKSPEAEKDLKEALLPILKLQSSSCERIGELDIFYKKIFEITGKPNSIIDQACGLNPLALLWMDLPKSCKYTGYDIDAEQIDFLNKAFSLLGIENAEAKLGDVLSDEFDYADVVFMLKLLPCLEHQSKGCSLDAIKRQKCKFAVVSFPAGSLSGKKKGMADFYRDSFKKLVENNPPAGGWQIKEILFSSELVFVIKK